ncbi:hypothetical protein B0T16DRAFT_450800 [Cercophora newfieldiana]|uniref:Uncharacterized protein n=1 Tax=Cercophora newfieldiana TaxID=92897 RepID=A0AA39YNC7_9PEZI|nr:hypothetical protein B0T16DRAFT_450800 [Cercophora newfieldiana]
MQSQTNESRDKTSSPTTSKLKTKTKPIPQIDVQWKFAPPQSEDYGLEWIPAPTIRVDLWSIPAEWRSATVKTDATLHDLGEGDWAPGGYQEGREAGRYLFFAWPGIVADANEFALQIVVEVWVEDSDGNIVARGDIASHDVGVDDYPGWEL